MEVEWSESGTATEVLGLEMVLELARRRLEAGRPRLKLEPELEPRAAISVPETAPAPGDPEAEAAWPEWNSAAPAEAMVDGEN